MNAGYIIAQRSKYMGNQFALNIHTGSTTAASSDLSTTYVWIIVAVTLFLFLLVVGGLYYCRVYNAVTPPYLAASSSAAVVCAPVVTGRTDLRSRDLTGGGSGGTATASTYSIAPPLDVTKVLQDYARQLELQDIAQRRSILNTATTSTTTAATAATTTQISNGTSRALGDESKTAGPLIKNKTGVRLGDGGKSYDQARQRHLKDTEKMIGICHDPTNRILLQTKNMESTHDLYRKMYADVSADVPQIGDLSRSTGGHKGAARKLARSGGGTSGHGTMNSQTSSTTLTTTPTLDYNRLTTALNGMRTGKRAVRTVGDSSILPAPSRTVGGGGSSSSSRAPIYASGSGTNDLYASGSSAYISSSGSGSGGGTQFSGGQALISLSDTLAIPTTLNRSALVDIDMTGGTTVFPVNTFLTLMTAINTNASTQAVPSIAGWILNNTRLSGTDTTNAQLTLLKTRMLALPTESTLIQPEVLTLQREYNLQLSQLMKLIGLNDAATMQGGSLSRKLMLRAPDDMIASADSAGLSGGSSSGASGDSLQAVLRRLEQTYSSKVFGMAGYVDTILTALTQYAHIMQTVSTATAYSAISIPILLDFTVALQDGKLQLAIQMLMDQLGSDADFDTDDNDDEIRNTSIIGIWRRIVGGDANRLNTSTINDIWCQYLYFESLLVTGALLLIESYHYPSAIVSQDAVLWAERTLTRITSMRDVLMPSIGPLAEPILIVMDEGEDGEEFSAKKGLIWLIASPADAKGNTLYTFVDSAAAANGVTINVAGYTTGWRMPKVTEINRLLSTKNTSTLTSYINGSAIATETGGTTVSDLDFFRSVGISDNYNTLIPGAGVEVKFWTADNSLAIVVPGKTSLSFATPTPDMLANVFAVHDYP